VRSLDRGGSTPVRLWGHATSSGASWDGGPADLDRDWVLRVSSRLLKIVRAQLNCVLRKMADRHDDDPQISPLALRSTSRSA